MRPTTRAGYKTVINVLKEDAFGKKKIADIKTSEAKMWLIELQDGGRSYSSIHSIRGVVRPAFAMAVEDDLLRKNPFDFELAKVLINDWVKQQSYNVNWSLCNTLEERNRSIKAECEGIIQKYAELVRGAYGILNNDGFGNNNQVEHIAEQKAKVVLQEMHGKDFSEYGFRDACIKAEMQLQDADKERSYERGVRIR